MSNLAPDPARDRTRLGHRFPLAWTGFSVISRRSSQYCLQLRGAITISPAHGLFTQSFSHRLPLIASNMRKLPSFRSVHPPVPCASRVSSLARPVFSHFSPAIPELSPCITYLHTYHASVFYAQHPHFGLSSPPTHLSSCSFSLKLSSLT